MDYSWKNIQLNAYKARSVIWVSVLFHVLAVFFSAGYYHPDEHFQLLEFAGWKSGWFSSESLAWEFEAMIRPSFMPAMTAVLINFLEVFGIESPFFIALVLRSISAALALSVTLLFYRWAKPQLQEKWQVRYLFFALLLWFIPYLNVRFSSENWSGQLFFLGLLCFLLKKEPPVLALFISGVFMGLSYACRFQSALFAAGFFFWLLFIYRAGFKKMFSWLLGITIAVLLSAVCDRWFYGEWTFTAYNYFHVNLLEGKASEFGTRPFWFYFAFVALHGMPFFGLLIAGCFFYFWAKNSRSVFTWVTLGFFIVHSIIAHKEMRFLFPLLPAVPFIVISAWKKLTGNPGWQRFFLSKGWEIYTWAFIIFSICTALLNSLKPADIHVPLYNYIYHKAGDTGAVFVVGGSDPFKPMDYPEINFYRGKGQAYRMFDSEQPMRQYADSTRTLPDLIVSDTLLQGSFDSLYRQTTCREYHPVPEWHKAFSWFKFSEKYTQWKVYVLRK